MRACGTLPLQFDRACVLGAIWHDAVVDMSPGMPEESRECLHRKSAGVAEKSGLSPEIVASESATAHAYLLGCRVARAKGGGRSSQLRRNWPLLPAGTSTFAAAKRVASVGGPSVGISAPSVPLAPRQRSVCRAVRSGGGGVRRMRGAFPPAKVAAPPLAGVRASFRQRGPPSASPLAREVPSEGHQSPSRQPRSTLPSQFAALSPSLYCSSLLFLSFDAASS